MLRTAGRCVQRTRTRSWRRWVCTSVFLPGLWTRYQAAPRSPDPPEVTERRRTVQTRAQFIEAVFKFNKLPGLFYSRHVIAVFRSLVFLKISEMSYFKLNYTVREDTCIFNIDSLLLFYLVAGQTNKLLHLLSA